MKELTLLLLLDCKLSEKKLNDYKFYINNYYSKISYDKNSNLSLYNNYEHPNQSVLPGLQLCMRFISITKIRF